MIRQSDNKFKNFWCSCQRQKCSYLSEKYQKKILPAACLAVASLRSFALASPHRRPSPRAYSTAVVFFHHEQQTRHHLLAPRRHVLSAGTLLRMNGTTLLYIPQQTTSRLSTRRTRTPQVVVVNVCGDWTRSTRTIDADRSIECLFFVSSREQCCLFL
jgi:hypothetical protein